MKIPSMHTQNGSALIIGLIFLVTLTVLGVTAMQATTLEEKMAGNQRDRSVAFQAAETALRDAEAYLFNTAAPAFVSTCVGGLCLATSPTNIPDWTNYTWNDNRAMVYAVSPSPAASLMPLPQIPNVSQQPRYFIVDLGINTVPLPGSSCGFGRGYRIVSHGWGQNINTQITLETTYAKC